MYLIEVNNPSTISFVTAHTKYICDNKDLYDYLSCEEVEPEFKGGQIFSNVIIEWHNIYGFPYYLKADYVIIEYMSYDKKCFKKYEFKNLQYSINKEDWRTLKSSWGNKNVIEFTDNICKEIGIIIFHKKIIKTKLQNC